eukprot:5148288-Alexandrium_andersonii.AAC.1
MSASLVGSEMCIRDSALPPRRSRRWTSSCVASCQMVRRWAWNTWKAIRSVSYTHLTLPTICSV